MGEENNLDRLRELLPKEIHDFVGAFESIKQVYATCCRNTVEKDQDEVDILFQSQKDLPEKCFFGEKLYKTKWHMKELIKSKHNGENIKIKETRSHEEIFTE